MNAPQTTTSLVQTGRRWVMIGIALITIGFSAPTAVADHMGNHERPLEESTPTTQACGQEAHEPHEHATEEPAAQIIGRPRRG